MILSISASSVGLWSYESGFTFPATLITPRESPALAYNRVLLNLRIILNSLIANYHKNMIIFCNQSSNSSTTRWIIREIVILIVHNSIYNFFPYLVGFWLTFNKTFVQRQKCVFQSLSIFLFSKMFTLEYFFIKILTSILCDRRTYKQEIKQSQRQLIGLVIPTSMAIINAKKTSIRITQLE